jgi:hypothetical protein
MLTAAIAAPKISFDTVAMISFVARAFLQSGHVEKCKTGTTLECVTLWASQTDEVNAL